MFITVKEAVGAPGLPPLERNIRITLNKLSEANAAHRRKRGGSKAFEYHIDCLPEAARQHFLMLEAQKRAESAKKLSVANDDRSSDEVWLEFEEATDKKKEIAQHRYQLAMMVKMYVEDHAMGMRAALRKVSDTTGTTYSSLHNWFYNKPGLKNIPVQDWLPSLLDRKGVIGTRTATLSPEAWSYFMADWLRAESPNYQECYTRLQQAALRNGWNIPTLKTLVNRIKTDIPQEVVVYCRGGMFKAKQTLIPAQRRTREGMYAMQRVSGDGHTLRIRCHLEDGTVIRPTVWVFQDVFSSAVVGYSIDISENTEMLGIALYNMVSKFGIPETFDLDRGSVALGDEVTGRMSRPKRNGSGSLVHKKFDNAEVEGVITAMGARVNWSRVEDDNVGRKGNARAKTVERLFHSVAGIGQFERHPAFAGAYTGSGPTDKPANYGETTVPVELVVEMFAEWVDSWNKQDGRRSEMARGIYSYQTVFEKSYQTAVIRKPTDTQLRLCLLRTSKPLTVHNGGLVELNAGRYSKHKVNRYQSDLLKMHIGDKVVLRFNPYDLTRSVHAYDSDGKYIGEIALYGDVAFDDISAARRHQLLQTAEVERAQFMTEQMGKLAHDELVALSRSGEKPDELGGVVPGITQMTPELPRALESMDYPNFEQKKRVAGHDTDSVGFLSDDVASILTQNYGKN